MRTTLDLDRDVLEAAKEMASRTRSTAGKVLSALARRALIMESTSPKENRRVVNGFEVLSAEGRIVTTELIQRLQEESESA